MIITVASGKGGVGKSNFVTNLGLALAGFGVNTLIVDCNLTNGDLGSILGPPFPKKTLHDVLNENASLREVVFDHPAGVRVITSGLAVQDPLSVSPKKLKKISQKLGGLADVVLVDAPGTLGENTVESLRIADKVILITTPEVTSYANALRTKKVAEKKGVDVLGTVVNKVRGNHRKVEKEAEEWIGTSVLCMLPYDESVIDAVEYGRPVLHHRPFSEYSIAMKKFGAELADVEYRPPHLLERLAARFFRF